MLGISARAIGRTESAPSRLRSRHHRTARASVLALASASFLIVGTGAANAAPTASQDGDPVGNLLGQVGQVVEQATKPLSQPAPAPAPAPNKAPAKPVKDLVDTIVKPLSKPAVPSSPVAPVPAAPTAPDQASSSVGDVNLGGVPVAGVSGNQAQAGGGTSSSSADLVSLGGYSVIGSQASSNGETTASGPVPAFPLCAATSGALCLGVTYADSVAAVDGSSASSKTGVADLCLGGDDPTGAACSGLHLGVAQGTSDVTTNPDGTNTSTAWSSLLNLCLHGDDGCTVGANAVEGSSGSGTAAPAPTDPTLLGADLAGTKAGLPTDPIHLDVPKDCDGGVLCAVLNEANPGSDGSTDQQSAANVDGLADNLGVTLGDAATGSTAHSTGNPPAGGAPATGPDFATGTLEHLQLADQQILDISKNESTGTTDQTAGHAVLLGVLGTAIIGSDAASDGTTSASGPVPEIPVCAATNGALCLDLLYADSAASVTDAAADASTQTGIADLCLGGSDPTGAACSGIEVGLGQGESNLHKDKTTGQSEASSSTSLANVCVAGTVGCTVSADAVASDGSANSDGTTGGSSTIADLGLDGTDVGAPGDPIEVSVPTGSCSDPLLCVLLNQGDASTGGDAASVSQTVLGATGLGDTVGADVAQSQVQASTAQVEPPVVEPPVVNPPVVDPPTVSTPNHATVKDTKEKSDAAGLLPNTGGVWGGLLGVALLLLVGGCAVLLGHRRRTA